jgi:ABC-type glycerol-3-phosphate transport system substrate-binding protein
MTSRKSLSRCFILLLAILLAIPGAGLLRTQAQEAKTLTIWVEGTVMDSQAATDPVKGAYGKYITEQFQKDHPGVTVKLENHGWDEELRQNLLTALMAGTGPDIVVGEAYFLQYAALGALLPIDEAVADVKSNMVEGAYAGAFLDGHIYGVSGMTGVFGFERNCAVVTAAGFDCDKPPATWDDLLAQAKTITEKGGGKVFGYTLQGPAGFSIGAVFRAAVFLAQSGATLCKDNCRTPYFNDPKALKVYEFLREIHKLTPPGLSFNPDEGQVYMQLFNGVSAYQVAGSWHPGWAKENGCKDCRYSAIPIPKDGQAASIVVGNVIYAGLKQTKNPDLVKAYLRMLVSDTAQDLVYSSMGRLPSTRTALKKLIDSKDTDPAIKQFSDVLVNSKSLLILPQWKSEPQKVWTIWNDLYTKVLTTDEPIQGLMDEAQKQADALSK